MSERVRKGPFEVTSTREVFKNPWIRVREDHVIRPDGRQGSFGIVEMKAGSSVLAVDEKGYAYLAREYKYAIEAESIEVMSGGLEAGESPLDGAKRELKEELGLEARDWIDLGMVDPFTTVVSSPNYLFLARGIVEGNQHLEDGECVQIVKCKFKDAVDMVMRGEITHSASCVLILKAQEYFRSIGQLEEW